MKTAIIIGAGPAGLSAAYELIKNSDIKPIIIDENNYIGGLSRTVINNGNRFDIGGHRFFTKNDRVNNLWQEVIPLKSNNSKTDKEFLTVKRTSRILFLNKFFDYPISINVATLKNLGPIRIIRMFFSYLKIKLFPIKEEKSLEDFFINRFGGELYATFFEDYTKKVWGVPCSEIPRDWGVQRVKDLSLSKTVIHFLKKLFNIKNTHTETSLVEEFFYPALGAGQMYEEMAAKIVSGGGQIILNNKVVKLQSENNKIKSVTIKEGDSVRELEADYFLSSMPIKDLINQMEAPEEIKKVASGLVYRDFIVVGLAFKKMLKKNETTIPTKNNIIPDNWIYVQEKNVKIGRLDVLNNFSDRMMADPNSIMLGSEYFCDEGDDFWAKSDEEIKNIAVDELQKINIADPSDLLDAKVVRQLKAYPAYFGTYNKFDDIKNFVNKFENLFLIGRNGTHRYNNMDHSVLSGLTAADNIINNITDKTNLWQINTEEEYHENKA